jgi:hypothetical protein
MNEFDGDSSGLERRKVPRCTLHTQVGLLVQGQYHMEKSFQVGEGGMMLSSATPLETEQMVTASFILYGRLMIIVRGKVRTKLPAKMGFPERYGIEFVGLGFQFKREIRNFVASATVANAA